MPGTDIATMPVDPAPTRVQARQAAEAEYAALVAMLEGLDDRQWAAPTECAPWSVRELVSHLAGAAEEAVRMRVQVRHLLGARGRAAGVLLVDALNDQQVADRSGVAPHGLLTEITGLAQRAPGARERTPWLVRRSPVPADTGAPAGENMAYLLDVIYTRDVWMHRIDISRATGCNMPASRGESAVVGQVVRDLARTWRGEPFRLTLTGRVAGTWAIGDVTPESQHVILDAVEACRIWSGRGGALQPKPATQLATDLQSVRLLF